MIRLSHILSIQSHESDSLEMTNFILKELKGLKNVTYEMDKAGNIYVIKGLAAKYPTYVCHIDSFHPKRDGFAIKRLPSNIWVGYRHFKGEEPEQLGIGGDDKVGIFIMLRMLESEGLECAKMVFFAKENDAGYGVAHCHMGFFENSKWVIACDRKGGNELVTQAIELKLASQEFSQSLLDVGKHLGYSLHNAVMTDLVTLKADQHLKVSMANVSVGFWHPRSANEHVVENDVFRAYSLCMQLARKIEWTYPHDPTAVEFSPTGIKALVPYSPPRPIAGTVCKYQTCTKILRTTERVICSDCMMLAVRNGAKCKNCCKLMFNDEDIYTGICRGCIPFMTV